MKDSIKELEGKVFQKVIETPMSLDFYYNRDDLQWDFSIFHDQECCERVDLEEVIGDIKDLQDTPILLADERFSEESNGECDSCSWSFFELRTVKGSVTLRFYGTSNGYYSETANLHYFSKEDNYAYRIDLYN